MSDERDYDLEHDPRGDDEPPQEEPALVIHEADCPALCQAAVFHWTRACTCRAPTVAQVEELIEAVEWVRRDMSYKAPEQFMGLMPLWVAKLHAALQPFRKPKDPALTKGV